MSAPPRRWFRRLVFLALAGALAVAGWNVWMVQRSQDRVWQDVKTVPPATVALVLGTSQRAPSGRTNRHWAGRMDATAALYKAGKVRHILVSGDNSTVDYNEPADMRDGLVERGVPAAAITLDFAGLRTLDSVIRAVEIFGVSRCIIVSDDFHLPRALWLADRHSLEATGFCGPALPWELSGKSRVREWLARVKAAGEEWILQRGAKHYGEKEPIPGT